MQCPPVNAPEGKDCEVAALALKVGIEETSLRPEPLIIHQIALGDLEAAIGMVEYGRGTAV